jgi:hypothetical protein
MRCPNCDEPLAEGAVFCKRCGTAARGMLSKPSEKLAELVMVLAIATGVVAVGGLIFAYALVDLLLKRGVDGAAVGGILMVALAGVFCLALLLARQSSHALRAYLRPFVGPEAGPAQLDSRQTAQLLDSPREPAPSVTEHTTRTFDPVYVDRAKK